MKKFLTVLLALSVVFTYTVGTAFAAEPTYAQKVVQAKASVLETLETNYNSMVKTLADKTVDGYKISKEAWTKVAADLKDVQEDILNERAKELAAKADDGDYKDLSVIEMTDALIEDDQLGDIPAISVANLSSALDTDAAARYQYTLDKADFIAKVGTVDLSVYSTTTPADAEQSYYDQAKAVVDEGIEKIKNPAKVIDEESEVAEVLEAYTQMLNSFKWRFVETSADSGVYKLNSRYAYILTITDEAAEATTLEAKKAALNSKVAAEAAAYMARCAEAAKDDADFDMEAAKAQKNAYVTVHTYRINALKTLDEADEYIGRIHDVEDAKSVIAEVNAVAELEKFAAKYKAEKDASGNIIRDAEAVDKIVESATTELYANMSYTDNEIAAIVEKAEKAIVANRVETLSADTVGLAKAALEAKREAALQNYYDLEQKAVNAKYDELIAKIDAAKTDAEVAKVAKNADLTGILTKGQVNALYNQSGACYSEFSKLQDKLGAYSEYLTALDSKKSFTNYNEAYWRSFCIDNDARTGAEVAALYDKAKAILDGVKNSDEIKAERKAVEAKIAALPADITLADKAAVEAAKDAHDAYLEDNNIPVCNVVNDYVLDNAIDALYKAEVKELNDAIKALPAKITAADKDALKAIVAKADAINDQITDGLYKGKTPVSAGTKVTDALDDIKEAEAKAIKDAVDALPLNITTSDADAIAAARALYDAYVAEYTDYAEGKVPAQQELAAVGADLFKAEAALKVAQDEANAKETAAVNGTHMKIYSSAAKGYIKISWKATNSDVALDGVEVYRSTKKTTGFKKISTFKVQTSKKYTTGLKKGTKYYYYVKGYKMVNGEKVYTHDSITVGRTFR